MIQENKTWGIRICVDPRKLNHERVIDPFLTSFTDEVLESVGG